jgi:FixJ family two-component response regulator
MTSSRPVVGILDDEPSVRQALQRLLRAADFEVETFASGTELLARLATRRPDCLILDLQMPGLSGFQVQARLAADGVALPVIVITGRATPEGRARALAGGAAAYLDKPVDESVLLAAVASALAGAPGGAETPC